MSFLAKTFSRVRQKLARPPRDLAMFFFSSIGARVVGIVCQLVQVAVVVKVLGAEAFGLWMSLNGLVALVAFADLGLGLGAQNRLAELFAHDSPHNRVRARSVFAHAFFVLAAVGLALGVAGWAVISHVDLAAVFGLRDPAVVAAAPGAALAVALVFCAGFPVMLTQRLAFARRQGWIHNVSQAAGSVLALAAVALAARSGRGLIEIALLGQGALVAAHALTLLLQLRGLGWLTPRRFRPRLVVVRSLMRVGAFFGLQQILVSVLFTLPVIVLSTTLGAAAVTPYNLVQRVFNLFAVVQNAFMLPLWPAYAQARARGEFDWIRRALPRSVFATLGLTVLPMALCAPFVPALIELWVGDRAEGVTFTLVALLCAWNAAVFLQQPFGYLLAGVSEVRRTTLHSLISAVVGVSLMFLLAPRLGAPGVALGLLGGFVPFAFLGAVIETRRYLRTFPSAPPSPDGLAPASASSSS